MLFNDKFKSHAEAPEKAGTQRKRGRGVGHGTVWNEKNLHGTVRCDTTYSQGIQLCTRAFQLAHRSILRPTIHSKFPLIISLSTFIS